MRVETVLSSIDEAPLETSATQMGDPVPVDWITTRFSERAAGWLSEYAQRHEPAPDGGIARQAVTDGVLRRLLNRDRARLQRTPDSATVAGAPHSPEPGHVGVDNPVVRRSVTRYDGPLLRAIFSSCRSTEFASLPAPLVTALLDSQFRMHRLDRERRWSHAVDEIIEYRGVPAGRLTVSWTSEEIRVVDLSILPGYQGHGIGTTLLTQLSADADEAELPLRMMDTADRARDPLFVRLGFRVIAEFGPDVEMER